MALSYQRATSNGTLTFIDVSIDYIERAEIKVFFDDVLTSLWSWSGSLDKRIVFPSALANGVVVTVRRITDASALRHEFSRGAAFIAQALDEDLKQALHIAQEASEGNPSGDFFQNINLHGFRLLNIGTAVDNTDALTLGQYKADALGAYQARLDAEAAVASLSGTGGAALVGYDGGTVQDVLDGAKSLVGYTALRAYTGRATSVRLSQVGIAGGFQYDPTDIVSADNGGTIIVDASGRRWKRIFLGAASLAWFGATTSSADNASPVNAALAAHADVTGNGATYQIKSPVTVRADCTLRDVTFQAGTAGINMVLFSSRSKLQHVKCVGTGTVSTVERGFYPATDGVTGARLVVAASNMTVGLQLAPLSTVTPSLNHIDITVTDIVGTTGASEGYGVLLSPASYNKVTVYAKNVKRHCLYLSAGACSNQCVVFVDTCYHHAVSLYATAGQAEVADNQLVIFARNLQNAPGQSGLSTPIGITQKANRNRAVVNVISSGLTDFGAYINGVASASGPWPTDNELQVTATGTFTGNAVLYSLDADNTMFVNPRIAGKAVSALVQLTDSGANTYTPKRAGCVRGGVLDGLDGTITGVANTAFRGAVDISSGVAFYRLASRVVDYSGTRVGTNKQYRKILNYTSIANGASSSLTATFPESLGDHIPTAQVISATSTSDLLTAVITAYTNNSVTVSVVNRSGVSQATVAVAVSLTGD